jgi:hypothetical protein
MKSRRKMICCRWGKQCAIVSILVIALVAAGDDLPEEPRWLMLRRADSYLSLDAEGEQQTTGSSGGGDTTIQRIYLAPAVGIGFDGSVYHPDLLSFSLRPEFQYVWQQIRSPNAPSAEQTSWLPNGTGTLTLLQTKPYFSTFTLSGAHDIHQYDFFNSATEDLRAWGVNTGYRTGPVPVTVGFQQSELDTDGLSQHSTFNQTTLNLHAHSDRADNNMTDLSYLYGKFDRTLESSGQSFQDSSDYHYVTLDDQEHFGKSSLNSTVLFNQLDSINGGSQQLNLALDYSIQHTENFRSLYDYGFTRYSDDLSDSMDNYLRAGVEHQLYESLSSAIDVHGIDSHSSSTGSELDVDTIGTASTENYSKCLGTWGRLTIGNAANYELTQQHSVGTQLYIAREAHTVTAASSFFRLKVPRVTSIVSITGDLNHGFQPLVEGVDYIVDTSVDPWQITIQFTSLTVQGLEIANGSVKVLVSYNVIPNPTGSYSSLADQFQVRLDLFHQLLGFYSRLNYIQNWTDMPGLVLENVNEFQAGADFSWRGLYLNGNYTDRDSSFYSYRAYGTSEGYSFRLPDNAGMGVDLHQQWSTYSPNQKIDYYDIMAHFDWQPTPHLNWKVEGGIQHQRGGGADQDLAIARSYLEWTQGRIRAHLGYEYQGRDLSGQTLESHFIYLRLRRYF